MILLLHGGLGDSACYTGIPEAYFKKFGSKLIVQSYHIELWENNPYCILGASSKGEKLHRLTFEERGDAKGWIKYRPQRVFSELTQSDVKYEDVQPNLYLPRNTTARRVVCCDEANWSSRRGYKYFPQLVTDLGKLNWETCLIRNSGNNEDREIFTSGRTVKFNLRDTIEFIATAELYIGYDSGLAHIAAGLGIPYILILGSTPPAVMKHACCLHAVEVCEHCCLVDCPQQCLVNSKNMNEEIMGKIEEKFA